MLLAPLFWIEQDSCLSLQAGPQNPSQRKGVIAAVDGEHALLIFRLQEKLLTVARRGTVVAGSEISQSTGERILGEIQGSSHECAHESDQGSAHDITPEMIIITAATPCDQGRPTDRDQDQEEHRDLIETETNDTGRRRDADLVNDGERKKKQKERRKGSVQSN